MRMLATSSSPHLNRHGRCIRLASGRHLNLSVTEDVSVSSSQPHQRVTLKVISGVLVSPRRHLTVTSARQ